MDHEQLVRRAGGGDVKAFVELASRFQQFAFGSALALVRDFQQAEDMVQESFVAAWSALPTLAEPAAFPGWLRGIVRHHAFRLRRRKQLASVSLAEAESLPNEEPWPTTFWSSAGKPPPRSPRLRICPTSCANRRRSPLSTTARTRTSRPSLGCR